MYNTCGRAHFKIKVEKYLKTSGKIKYLEFI
jgi:hypothetical protein